jgi:3' terminal RNA ribose 2'-O-methyltransferase Hen1
VLLTLSTTHTPAGDLGYLLHKHPAKIQSFDLAFGHARVFYPECTDDRCTVALLLDIDPIALVRGRGRERTLDQYVNDRPYVASSMLSVAIAQVFGSALAGKCKDRPHLVGAPIPLTARLAAVPCRAGEDLLRRLFEPLGYSVTIGAVPLDPAHAEWGSAGVYSLEISGTVTLSDLLSHLYVLIPVLDNDKHYWVGDDEVDKLLRHGEGWLNQHPERDLIATRYLKYRRNLLDDALKQLREQDGEGPEGIDADSAEDPREEAGERRLSLHEQRHGVILSILQARGARSVIDLGCGEGRLLRDLVRHKVFERVVGMDVSHRSLQIAADRLRLDALPPMVRQRLDLIHGSLMYRDVRLSGFDAGILCEVIEHMDPPRLAAMERVVFEQARPRLVIVTTPNREYNVKWESLPAGAVRNRDHRFEWTREEFRRWAARVCARFGYSAEFRTVGDEDPIVGAPTQMAVFSAGTPGEST